MLQYLEPRTDVPAKDDWSTRLALAATRFRTEDRVTALLAAATLAATPFVPSTPGNRIAVVVLSWMLLMYVPQWLAVRPLWHAQRRGLLDEPWRRVPAAVVEQQNDRADRLLLDGLVLKGSFRHLPDVVPDLREVFLCGPDADGRALVRAAGSTSMYPAVVDEGEYRARERVERTLGRPGDEPRIRGVIRQIRWTRLFSWLLLAMVAALTWMLVATSLVVPAPTGLIAAALLISGLLLLVPEGIEVSLRDFTVARAVAGSQAWTPVPVVLSPWQRGQHVTGIAELPDGAAQVRFPRPWIDLVANIADTKVMWIAGTHKGVLAVGVPGTNLLNSAEVRPDRTAAQSDPMPWWKRYRRPDFSALPR